MERILFTAALAVAALSLTGCTSPPGDEEEEFVATDSQAAKIENGLTVNSLMNNGLTVNGLTVNGLTVNGLTVNGLTNNSDVMDLLEDPVDGSESRKILAYVVSCALPLGERIELTIGGDVHWFHGALGLAPEWGLPGGSCGADCQSWVSGCLLSRVNYSGETVEISVRSPHPATAATQQEIIDYPSMEAAYYGDLFSDPPRYFACTAHGSTLIERVCGPSISSCAVTVVGDCDDYFFLNGNWEPRCGIPDTTEGYHPDCRDDQGNTYLGTMTVFRQCGNGVCDATETNLSCPVDCP